MTHPSKWLLLAVLLPAMAQARDWKVLKGYDGADLPDDRQVHLLVSQESDRHLLVARSGLSLWKIDGRKVGGFLRDAVVDEVVLAPGKHRVGYTAMKLGGGFAQVELWFVAEPGKRYVSRSRMETYGAFVWIEDAATGQPVGGVIGSDDEPAG